MSTNWIKLTVGLRTHPKVVRMSTALKADRLRVVGGLFAVWCIFDEHSHDGFLEGYTFAVIDEELGWKGFAKAMESIGWLIDEGDAGITAPRFEEHNGTSAKRRAMETERKRLEREQMKVGQLSASDADRSVTREEKRREEEKREEEKGAPGGCSTPAARTLGAQASMRMKDAGMAGVSPSHPKLLALLDAGITLDELSDAAADAVSRGKPFAYALSTAEGRRRDAATAPLPAAGSGETAWQRSQRERAFEISGGLAARKAPGAANTHDTFDMEPTNGPRLAIR